ncbi:flavin reductase [Glaciecola sp. XM2]|jgi:flavin reductase (DIM6/NTAB) family NADH-FMN oxidoreductase RutF|uniref:flavin reductase family protein n=1 Tax=Glaciecola sp. XM2 TaxID=1914931 RepID=UPI001BDECB3E|nr:flavin reductase [Glaciecola sp. XM2]MBT1451525.1 flavin reductase [Glaciecola sp. XM2]
MAKYYGSQDIQNLDQRVRANLINSLSGFKSANLMGTKSDKGVENLAMISSAFHVGANPPLMGILMRPHTVTRDSLENIKASGFFTLNHVNETMVEQAHQCSARYEPDQSEFAATGLTPQYSEGFFAPYVAQSNIKLGLELREIQVLNINLTELVIAQIVEIQTHADYQLEDGYLDIDAANSVCVSGLDSYHRTERVARLSYAKPDTPLHSIWKKST